MLKFLLQNGVLLNELIAFLLHQYQLLFGFFLLPLDVLSHFGVKGELFDDVESSGVFVVSYPDGFINSVLFDEGPEFTHFLVHVVVEVKIVQLRQSQLAVVVVKTFLGNTYLFGRILQIHFLLWVVRFGCIHVEISPMFDKRDNFGYCSLFASVFHGHERGVLVFEVHAALIFIKR